MSLWTRPTYGHGSLTDGSNPGAHGADRGRSGKKRDSELRCFLQRCATRSGSGA